MLQDRFDSISAAASRAHCPVCNHDGLEFVLRCDLGQGPCLFAARCDRCAVDFEIVVSATELSPTALIQAVGPCDKCGQRRQIATLSCSERSLACMYHVRCPSCDGP